MFNDGNSLSHESSLQHRLNSHMLRIPMTTMNGGNGRHSVLLSLRSQDWRYGRMYVPTNPGVSTKQVAVRYFFESAGVVLTLFGTFSFQILQEVCVQMFAQQIKDLTCVYPTLACVYSTLISTRYVITRQRRALHTSPQQIQDTYSYLKMKV